MILEVLENQREIVPHRVEDFLTALLDIPLPAPTERFTVKINNPMNSQSDTSLKFLEYSFERPNDLQAIQHHVLFFFLFFFFFFFSLFFHFFKKMIEYCRLIIRIYFNVLKKLRLLEYLLLY